MPTVPHTAKAPAQKVSPVTKYLTIPTAVPKEKPPSSASSRAMTGARVLTSAECLAIIKEKEERKRKQEEEKEERKRIREANKKSEKRKSRRNRNREH